MDGAILLHRSLLESYAFANETTLKIWIWLLLRANWKKSYAEVDTGGGKKTIAIDRGQVLYGRNKASEALQIKPSTIERHLEKLEDEKQIQVKAFSKYSIISINKYNDYQLLTKNGELTADRLRTDCGQTADTYNNNNKDNKEEVSGGKPPTPTKENNIEERKKIFVDSLKEYLDKYGKDLLNAFYKYWTEKNKSGTKMKFELQKTWETNLRLSTWASRDKEFPKPKNTSISDNDNHRDGKEIAKKYE